MQDTSAPQAVNLGAEFFDGRQPRGRSERDRFQVLLPKRLVEHVSVRREGRLRAVCSLFSATLEAQIQTPANAGARSGRRSAMGGPVRLGRGTDATTERASSPVFRCWCRALKARVAISTRSGSLESRLPIGSVGNPFSQPAVSPQSRPAPFSLAGSFAWCESPDTASTGWRFPVPASASDRVARPQATSSKPMVPRFPNPGWTL